MGRGDQVLFRESDNLERPYTSSSGMPSDKVMSGTTVGRRWPKVEALALSWAITVAVSTKPRHRSGGPRGRG